MMTMMMITCSTNKIGDTVSYNLTHNKLHNTKMFRKQKIKRTQQRNVTDTISNKKKQQHRGKVKKKS